MERAGPAPTGAVGAPGASPVGASPAAVPAKKQPDAATHEWIAHTLAYKGDGKGAEKENLNEDDLERLRREGYGPPRLVRGEAGLEMWYLPPAEGSGAAPVLTFRGTQFDPNSLLNGEADKDLATDFDAEGVGHAQFEQNKALIQATLEEAGQHGPVTVSGHSLGGALAQKTAALDPDRVKQVQTFQSAGVDGATIDKLIAYNERVTPDQRVDGVHWQHADDVVSKVGDGFTPGTVVTIDPEQETLCDLVVDAALSSSVPLYGPVTEGQKRLSAHRQLIVRDYQQKLQKHGSKVYQDGTVGGARVTLGKGGRRKSNTERGRKWLGKALGR